MIALTVDDFQADLNSYRSDGQVSQAVYDELFELFEEFGPMPTEYEAGMMLDALDDGVAIGRMTNTAYDRLTLLAYNWLAVVPPTAGQAEAADDAALSEDYGVWPAPDNHDDEGHEERLGLQGSGSFAS